MIFALYKFTKEDDVLSTDDEETMGFLGPFKVLVVTLNSVFKEQVS